MLVYQRVMIPVGVMIGETKKPSNFWGEMYRGHLMNCEAKLRGRTVGGEAWARKGIKFQAPRSVFGG